MPLSGGPRRPGKPRSYPDGLEPSMVLAFDWLRKQKESSDQHDELPTPIPPTRPMDDGYNQGVPIGGFGSGSIGRSYRGDFSRWHLRIGRHEYQPSLPNQFHLRVQNGNDTVSQTLNPRTADGSRLEKWNWGMDSRRATYYALFPRAWTEYNYSDYGVHALCQQLAPIIAHNYKESSYPVGVFSWKLRNVANNKIIASLMLTWENGISPSRLHCDGDSQKIITPSSNRLLIEQSHEKTDDNYPISFGLGIGADSNVELSYLLNFDTESKGSRIWRVFSKSGSFENIELKPPKKPHRQGSILCAEVELSPDETAEIVYTISWDIPKVRFGYGREWYRYYTKFFGFDGQNATRIASTALDNWQDWNSKIIEWQKPILTSDRPDWLKSALFNELYYLVDGGTTWEAGEVGKGLRTVGTGHFGCLECFDYPYVNTYDVHFYSSFALLMNWPEIDNSIQRDFADSIEIEDTRMVDFLFEGGRAMRKPSGIIPHDLGIPEEDPWHSLNGYRAQDVSRWKDLNSKFVLQVYRNYIFTKNLEFLQYCWSSVKRAMEFIDQFDKDDDGLPENEGFPDQTYDHWIMEGCSAYCGSLYLAAVQALIAMAQLLNEDEIVEKYKNILETGKKSFEEKLWNGRYYYFDNSKGKGHEIIMADQLAGQWYVRTCNLPSIVPPENAKRAMQTIFNFNVMQFCYGEMGVVNGMYPDGSIDKNHSQSSEVWSGVSYSVAALMAYEGMKEQALRTAEGVYKVTYEDRGYWFRTPEAWTENGNFRASMYMRPLSIWALEHALRSIQEN
jgi:non-lysosomal glucosylceramidase